MPAATTMLYGASGTYKTTQVGEFAKYVYARTGKMTRLVSADSGGWEPIKHLIYDPILNPDGIIDAYRLARVNAQGGLENPRAKIRKLTRGEWPRPAKLVGGMPVVCPLEEATCLTFARDDKDWEKIGGQAFESTSSMGELLLRDLIDKGKKLSEDIVSKYEEEKESMGAAGRSHYMAAQSDIAFLITEAPAVIPVPYMMFTAHESKGKDETTGMSVYGPAVVGSALTGKIEKDLGALLHCESMVEKAQGKPDRKVVRMYYERHPDSENSNIMWPAKPRVTADKRLIQELSARFPGGYVELDFNTSLFTYLEFIDELQRKGMAGLAAWKAAADAKRAETQAVEAQK